MFSIKCCATSLSSVKIALEWPPLNVLIVSIASCKSSTSPIAILSAKNSLSIYIPPGFAHGFCALDKENFVVYSCTQYRNARSETGIDYNDKDLNIKWPIKKTILSIKDKKNYSLKEFCNKTNG